MNLLFLQPAAQVASLGVDVDRLRPAARFGVVNLASLERRLAGVDAVVNCIDTSPTARRVVDAAARARVPRIYLFDGIYDMANAYRNPRHRRSGIDQMDPVLYTHLACVDRWSHRTFAAMGLCTHAWLPTRAAPEEPGGATARRATFLIATARSPAFDAAERERLRRLLARTVEALHRLRATFRFRTRDTRLLASLGIPATANDTGDDFARCIHGYDCLITTPSTVATTAMLSGKPTATLDYRDSPLTQQSGWRIHESTDIEGVLSSMAQPARDRMAFQAREVAHLVDASPVEDFILRAAGGAPPASGATRVSLEYPLRWLYVNCVKPFRKSF